MVIDQLESADLIHKNNTNLVFPAVMFIKYRAGRVNETNNNIISLAQLYNYRIRVVLSFPCRLNTTQWRVEDIYIKYYISWYLVSIFNQSQLYS